MQAALDSVVQDVSVNSLAFEEPSFLLLHRACTFASFSLQAYDGLETESATAAPQVVHGQKGAHLLDVHEVNQSVVGAQSGQYWMWDVEELGMVVAFRGTVDVFDALTDLSCRPTQLQCVSADDAIMLHSGIYLGVLSCCARIHAAYCKLASDYSAAQKAPPPLFVTGSSVPIDTLHEHATHIPY